MELHLELEHDSTVPLYRQLYEQIRNLILDGAIEPGTKLPPSRHVAQSHSIARVTVTAAYEQLRAEGYVASRVGAGTFVSQIELKPFPREEPPGKYMPALSSWGQRVQAADDILSRPISESRRVIDFGFGRSFPHIFPYDIWRRLLARYLSTDDTMLSHYGSAAGFYPLREAVAGYLNRLRGVHCSADQLFIVSGMQQALDLLARLLLTENDEILVETPGYSGAFQLFKTFGVHLQALTVDQNGFPVERIPSDTQARLAFVTPSNQFPRGGTMPLERRLALLKWAREKDALILEDDYDGELRYSGHPISALQGVDRHHRVIYLGTFSKVLFPALRLGYVVLPPSLVEPFHQAMRLVDRGAPTLTQAAVTDFITEGHFERHLQRLRKEYGLRRRALVETVDRCFSTTVAYSKVEAGLHVMLILPDNIDENDFVRESLDAGVGVYPGGPYYLEPYAPPSVLLGFSGLNTEEIKEGVERLSKVLDSLVRR